jgi:prevent-host-death family protein
MKSKAAKAMRSAPSAAVVEEVPATVAKNEFGRVLDVALAGGRVVITKHDVPRAVLLSAEAYAALAGDTEIDLDALEAEFDALLEAMQKPEARAATDALFTASAAALGKAALAQARKRKPARVRG